MKLPELDNQYFRQLDSYSDKSLEISEYVLRKFWTHLQPVIAIPRSVLLSRISMRSSRFVMIASGSGFTGCCFKGEITGTKELMVGQHQLQIAKDGIRSEKTLAAKFRRSIPLVQSWPSKSFTLFNGDQKSKESE